MFSTVFERAIGSFVKILPSSGPLAYVGLAIAPAGLFLAAMMSSMGFWRKYGLSERTFRLQKVLVPVFLFVWNVLSLLLIGALSRFPNGFLSYGTVFLADSLVGCASGYGAVIWTASRSRRAGED
jgi:hypothetical protein